MSDNEEKEGELVTEPNAQPAQWTEEDKTKFFQIGRECLEHLVSGLTKKHAFNERVFNKIYWLVTAIIFAIFGISAGLMFAVDNGFNAGLAILTHVTAILAGLVGGMGIGNIGKDN